MEAMIDAVLLDAGGVLTLPDVDLVRSALAPFGVRPDDAALDRAHDCGMAAVDGAAMLEDGFDTFLTAYVRAAGIPPARASTAAAAVSTAFKAAPHPWSRVRPGAVDGLRAICDSGASVAIVSNASGTVEQQLLAMGLCQVEAGPAAQVAAIIDSAVVGVAKPDAHIFALALEKLAVRPEHALHVGDSVHFDVEGAHAAGLRALHFDPHRLCRRTDHRHVAALTHVAELVAASG